MAHKLVQTLLILALLLCSACAKQGLLIPLENDLPDNISTRTYMRSLNNIPGYHFTLAPEIAPDAPLAEWTDADIARLAATARKREVDVITFGRVKDVHSTIGFLRPDSEKITDTRYEHFTIHWPGRDPTLERVLKEYLADQTAR